MSHPAFTPLQQSITALWLVLISRLAEGRRLSWPGWLGEIMVCGLPARRRSAIPVLAAATGNRTPDHRVANPTP